jgi:hypothetical protein
MQLCFQMQLVPLRFVHRFLEWSASEMSLKLPTGRELINGVGRWTFAAIVPVGLDTTFHHDMLQSKHIRVATPSVVQAMSYNQQSNLGVLDTATNVFPAVAITGRTYSGAAAVGEKFYLVHVTNLAPGSELHPTCWAR